MSPPGTPVAPVLVRLARSTLTRSPSARALLFSQPLFVATATLGSVGSLFNRTAHLNSFNSSLCTRPLGLLVHEIALLGAKMVELGHSRVNGEQWSIKRTTRMGRPRSEHESERSEEQAVAGEEGSHTARPSLMAYCDPHRPSRVRPLV